MTSPNPWRGTGRRYALAILLAGLLAACSSSDEASFEPVAATDVTMTLFRPFAAGEYVFRSREQLDAALAAAPFRTWPIGLVTQEPAIPNWDFQNSMIVGISFGEGPWCTAPRFTEITSNGVDVQVRYERLESGTLACMFLSPLIRFVQVPRTEGRVEFRAATS